MPTPRMGEAVADQNLPSTPLVGADLISGGLLHTPPPSNSTHQEGTAGDGYERHMLDLGRCCQQLSTIVVTGDWKILILPSSATREL